MHRMQATAVLRRAALLRAVVLAGRYFGRDDLDRMPESVARAAAELDAAPEQDAAPRSG